MLTRPARGRRERGARALSRRGQHPRRPTQSIAIALTLAIGGCAADVPTAQDAGVSDVAPDGMPPLRPPTATLAFVDGIKVDCDDAFRCRASFPDGDAIFQQYFGATDDDCVDTTLDASQSYIDAVQASVDAARIIYSADDAGVCLTAEQALTCDGYWNGALAPAACQTTFRGKVPTGGACTLDADCDASNDRCGGDPSVCGPAIVRTL